MSRRALPAAASSFPSALLAAIQAAQHVSCPVFGFFRLYVSAMCALEEWP